MAPTQLTEFFSVETGFITLKSEDVASQAAIDSAMVHLGPHVALSLMRNIGGNASRSELDKLSEPLKKLVHHLHAQDWLARALRDPSFPSSQVSDDDKALFLRKVIKYVPVLSSLSISTFP